jgi:nucleoside-diphosphate-sugar epimerase
MSDKMELLWDRDLRMNTVHVFDVARAIFWAAKKASNGAIFNLADKGETDQGKITSILGAIFGIETGFYGSMKSNLAAVRMRTDTASACSRLLPACCFLPAVRYRLILLLTTA